MRTPMQYFKQHGYFPIVITVIAVIWETGITLALASHTPFQPPVAPRSSAPPVSSGGPSVELQRICNQMHRDAKTGTWMVIEGTAGGGAKPDDQVCYRWTNGDSQTCEKVADARRRLNVP